MKKFFYGKIFKFVFYGCKQKNNNNIFIQLDLKNNPKIIKINEISQD